MRPATIRTAVALLATVAVLAACNGTEDIKPPAAASPAPPSAAPPSTTPLGAEPEPLDGDAAVGLYVAWRETVYALPPTEPEAVDVEVAGDGIVVPDSDASAWVVEELELASKRGVIVRGTVRAETIQPVQVVGERATASMCSSADVRPSDLVTGEPVGRESGDRSYTRFDAHFRLIGDDWLVEGAERSDDQDCVPPSIEQALATRWEQFVEGWYERDRRGGGKELGALTEVVTDRFAQSLSELPARGPVPDPPPFTQFETTTATRSTATGHACRSGGLETVEWVLFDGQWRVDFVGQAGPDPEPCP